MTDPGHYDEAWNHRRAVHPRWPEPTFLEPDSDFEDAGLDCG